MGNVRMRAEQINYGATNVKVALDDLDPAALIELNNRMNRIDAWKATVKTEEKTGAEVTFTNALALAALSLSADIEPIQDLHGYDKPWVGGAGKNKLENNNAQNTEVNGITVTVDSQGVIDLDGTATANTFIYTQGTGWGIGTPPTTLVNGQTYTLGYGHTDAEMGSMRFALYGLKNNDTVFSVCADASAPFTHQFVYDSTITSFFAYIRIMNGTHLDHFKLYPQIEQGTSETTFAPYENICPISGHTSVTITRTDAESQTADFTIQLGQTVYGGTVNVTTGELTVDRVSVAPTEIQGVNSYNNIYYWQVLTGLDSVNGANVISSHFKSKDALETGCTYVAGQGKQVIAVPSDQTLNTKALADAWMVANAPQFVYKLATPIELTLTPVAVEMLKGYNQISSDGGGDITVEAYTGAAWGGDE